MKHVLPLLLCLLYLPACQTVRTTYDENGHEVKEHTGQERSFEDYMQETFDSEVTRRKNKDGVPESSSSKVSRYQKAIDDARRDTSTFQTGSYSGTKSFDRNKNFSGAGKAFDTGAPYKGAFSNSAYSKDLRPDFMSDTKGIYSRDDAYADFGTGARSNSDGQAYAEFSSEHVYGTNSSNFSRDDASGYIESRRDNTAPPRIINHRDYYKKSLFETRALLGRDNEPAEE